MQGQKYNLFFSGNAGSGKTFCSKYFIENQGYLHGKMALPIYASMKQYFGLDEKNKDRLLMQTYGDIARTEIREDFFINRFEEDMYIIQRVYNDIYKKEVNFVIDDVRFFNEFKILSELEWIGFYLEVPEEIRLKRLENRDGTTQQEQLDHKSEKELDLFKHKLIKIDASGTVEECINQIKIELEKINQRKEVDF